MLLSFLILGQPVDPPPLKVCSTLFSDFSFVNQSKAICDIHKSILSSGKN